MKEEKEFSPETDFPEIKRNYLTATLTCRCPRCRQGKLFSDSNLWHFSNILKMPKHCPVCGQPTEIEMGFYTGAAYVSYALTVALGVASFVAWKVLFGMTFSFGDNRIFWWFATYIVLLIVLLPWLVRVSRSLWLSWFVSYDKDWRIHPPEDFERINPIGMEQ